VSVPLPSGSGVATVVVPPAHGSVVVQDGVIVYTPSPGFVGTDTATVQVTDTLGNVRTVDVTFTVLATSPVDGVSGTSESIDQLSRLPRTGGLATGPLALGLSLIVLGGLAVAWSRRREV
jgi:LPXTG-motif cell wall-anchored protein